MLPVFLLKTDSLSLFRIYPDAVAILLQKQ